MAEDLRPTTDLPPTEADLAERRRRRLLLEWLDRLDAEHGPVDEALIEKYVALLR